MTVLYGYIFICSVIFIVLCCNQQRYFKGFRDQLSLADRVELDFTDSATKIIMLLTLSFVIIPGVIHGIINLIIFGNDTDLEE